MSKPWETYVRSCVGILVGPQTPLPPDAWATHRIGWIQSLDEGSVYNFVACSYDVCHSTVDAFFLRCSQSSSSVRRTLIKKEEMPKLQKTLVPCNQENRPLQHKLKNTPKLGTQVARWKGERDAKMSSLSPSPQCNSITSHDSRFRKKANEACSSNTKVRIPASSIHWQSWELAFRFSTSVLFHSGRVVQRG